MKIKFDIFNRQFFRTLTCSLKLQKKTQVSIIYMNNTVSSTFLYNGNSKCYVVRILYAISFQVFYCPRSKIEVNRTLWSFPISREKLFGLLPALIVSVMVYTHLL